MAASGLNPDGQKSVPMSEFIRTRDSVVTGLTKLNGAISTLISAYVSHTNQLLNSSGQGQATLDTKEFSDFLTNAGLVTAPSSADSKEKKKRPKKEKDPNAPKRPLTAFFLFSTRARDHIKHELGASATPVEVNTEILRRWTDMEPVQKEKWRTLYTENFDKYKRDVAEYKSQTGNEIIVEDAAFDHELPHLDSLDAAAGAVESSDSSDSEDDSDEDEKEPTPPPPPPPTKRSKTTKKKTAATSTPALTKPASPSPSAQLTSTNTPRTTMEIPVNMGSKKRKVDSPEAAKKKRSRKSEPLPPAPPTPVAAPEPEKKKKKKTKKGEA